MTETSPQNKGIKDVLANRNFRNLWIGQTISQIGDGMSSLTLLIVINQLTGSTAALATAMIVVSVPQLVFGLIAGVFVDRWDRKKIMIASDILRGFLVLGLVLVRRPEDVWLFYVLGFFQALVGVFFDPAKSAMIPTIVDREHLLAANALSQTTRVVTSTIGAALAGVLAGWANSGAPAFVLDSLTFFVSALFILRLSVPHKAALAEGGVRQTLEQMRDGLVYLFSSRLLVSILIVFAVTMLGLGAVNVLFVPFLSNILLIPTEALGVVDAAQVVGMVLGSSLVAVLAVRLKPNQMIVLGMIMVGLMVTLIGTATAMWMVLVCLFLLGLFLTPVQTAAATLLQGSVSNELRGRANAALNTVMTTASVISMGLSGLLGDAIGIREVFYLSGAIAILAGFLAASLMRGDKNPALATGVPPAV